ncbi:hypothetical protein ACFQH6_15945 [Halobacteriaceae archaeon GCM10025711]
MNLRLGYDADGRTLRNLVWASDACGPPPENLAVPEIDAEDEGTVTAEWYLDGAGIPDDPAVHVDGHVLVRTWLDVPSTKRLPSERSSVTSRPSASGSGRPSSPELSSHGYIFTLLEPTWY